MSDEVIIHATLVSIDGYGVLLQGKSGSGKSDLALRLIENKKAVLVADDEVVISIRNGKIVGKAPENLKGLLEIRGVGICKYPSKQEEIVNYVIQLKDDPSMIERMPKNNAEIIFGVEIQRFDLYAKESSAPDKIMAILFRAKQDE